MAAALEKFKEAVPEREVIREARVLLPSQRRWELKQGGSWLWRPLQSVF